jgi:hypothetical protein
MANLAVGLSAFGLDAPAVGGAALVVLVVLEGEREAQLFPAGVVEVLTGRGDLTPYGLDRVCRRDAFGCVYAVPCFRKYPLTALHLHLQLPRLGTVDGVMDLLVTTLLSLVL